MKIEEKAMLEFKEALEGLRGLGTREELEAQRKIIAAKREKLTQVAGLIGKTARAGANAHFAKRQRPTTDTVKPLGDDADRVIWICRHCGNRRVNFRVIKGRARRRAFLPKYLEFLKTNGEPMTFDEAKMMIGKGVPFCFKCKSKVANNNMVRRKVGAILAEKLEKEGIK